MKVWPILLLCIGLFTAGCGDDHGAPPHTAAEEKAVNDVKNATPEQQIERAQNSPMPQSAKDALIKSIKDKNGIK